jgi:hypothetical protein
MICLEDLLEQAQSEADKILAENKRMRERFEWLKSEPGDNRLTDWQKLVVREGLGLSMNYCDLPKEEPKSSTVAKGSLGAKITKLAAYFEKRAKENTKRAKDKEEQSKSLRVGGFCSNWANEAENSGYYFSGKADTYQRASEKVKELLREPEEPKMFGGFSTPAGATVTGSTVDLEDKPAERWVVECYIVKSWQPSGNTGLYKVEFASEEEAQRAIEEHGSKQKRYRVVRKRLATLRQDVPEKWIVEHLAVGGRERSQAIPGEYPSEDKALQAIEDFKKRYGLHGMFHGARRIDVPEKWIVETKFSSGWDRSVNVDKEFTTEAEADAAIAKQTDGMLRRARKVD